MPQHMDVAHGSSTFSHSIALIIKKCSQWSWYYTVIVPGPYFVAISSSLALLQEDDTDSPLRSGFYRGGNTLLFRFCRNFRLAGLFVEALRQWHLFEE